ncbi:MAG TPA: hypothetical protein VGF59_25950, partial [Bryobacteraceae bacterium]
SGGGQSTQTGTTFAQPLTAVVFNDNSNPAPGIAVTFSAPASGPSGFFPGGALTYTALTGLTGAISAPFAANSTPGSYDVIATAAGVPGQAVFHLTNLPPAPLLTAAIASKSGPLNARQYALRIINTGGPASGAFIKAITFAAAAGSTCAPQLAGSSRIVIGDIPAAGSVTLAPITIDFSSCTAVSRFSLTLVMTLNGVFNNQTLIGNQFP